MNNDLFTGARRLEVTLQKTSLSAFVGSTLQISGVFHKSYFTFNEREGSGIAISNRSHRIFLKFWWRFTCTVNVYLLSKPSIRAKFAEAGTNWKKLMVSNLYSQGVKSNSPGK